MKKWLLSAMLAATLMGAKAQNEIVFDAQARTPDSYYKETSMFGVDSSYVDHLASYKYNNINNYFDNPIKELTIVRLWDDSVSTEKVSNLIAKYNFLSNDVKRRIMPHYFLTTQVGNEQRSNDALVLLENTDMTFSDAYGILAHSSVQSVLEKQRILGSQLTNWDVKNFYGPWHTDEIPTSSIQLYADALHQEGLSFTSQDIARLHVKQVPTTAIDSWEGYDDARHAYLNEVLFAGFPEFIDTEKPNCLYIYPVSDHNNSLESEVHLIDTLSSVYDVDLAIVNTKQDFLDALNRQKNTSLTIISGHSAGKTIRFGPGSDRENTRYYGVYDNEIQQYISKLPENSTVFLNGCKTGIDELAGDNITNSTARYLPGVTAIGSEVPFSGDDIVVSSLFPFDIDIVKTSYDGTSTNYTYKVMYTPETDLVQLD